MTYRRRAGLSTRVVDGEAVVLDRGSGRVHQLNPTATLIWSKLEAAVTLEEIATALAGGFQVDLPTARADAARVLEDLGELELLESESS